MALELAAIQIIIYTEAVETEWDSSKNADNIRKHGIDFETAKLIFDGPTLERIDDRFDYGELRIAAVGVVLGVEVTVYYTLRGQSRRLISARKATRNEREQYYQAIFG